MPICKDWLCSDAVNLQQPRLSKIGDFQMSLMTAPNQGQEDATAMVWTREQLDLCVKRQEMHASGQKAKTKKRER